MKERWESPFKEDHRNVIEIIKHMKEPPKWVIRTKSTQLSKNRLLFVSHETSVRHPINIKQWNMDPEYLESEGQQFNVKKGQLTPAT